MSHALALNIVAIVCIASAGGIFNVPAGSVDGPRWFSAVWCALFTIGISVMGWVIFVAAHFIGRYW